MIALAWGAFVGGALVGIVLSVGAGSVLAWYAYRRVLRLQQRAREAERLAELGTLTGGLAHEIKNPLSTVQLNLQLLQEDLDPSQESYSRLSSRLATVQRETTRLREILDDFLRYAGRMELDRRPTELNGLLEDLFDFFLPQAQLNRVQLRLQKHEAPLTAPVDPRLVKQAVLNLLLNGLQAMPEGGELILRLGRDDGQAVIHVIDTGPGIPPDVAARIFDAYFTTKRGGTGLGLAMARRIAREHQGAIAIASEPGKGSDFMLRLPLDHD